MKKLFLTACVALLGTATADACSRRQERQQERQARRQCVSPAPARPAQAAPQYDTIPRPVVPVPAIPPGVVMPSTGLLTLPARVVQSAGGCVGGVCPTR